MSTSTTALQATSDFYASNPATRVLCLALGTSQRLWPALGLRLAYRLFGTPLPPRWLRRDRAWPGAWTEEHWAFEDASLTLHHPLRHPAAPASSAPAEGACVLLVHGWGGHAGQMLPLAQALIVQGLRPVLLDLPAHGKSAGRVRGRPEREWAEAPLEARQPMLEQAVRTRLDQLSARLGDVLSYLYLASIVLKQHHDAGSPAEDQPIVEWACRDLLYRAQEQLHGFLRNFPNRLLAMLLRALIFPRGRTYSAPSDKLGAQVVELAMTPSPSRERLCRHAFRTALPGNAVADNPLAELHEALQLAQVVEPIERKLRIDGVKTGKVTALDFPGQVAQALQQGIIDAAQASTLLDYDRRIMRIINVDDFDPSELPAGGSSH